MSLAGAPIFPSLIKEASLGYDLELPIIGCPVFLQFKLCERMVGELAKGADKVGIPHYRMRLRSPKYSKQHDLLLALEGKGHQVFYSAPEFHMPPELNGAYLKREVVQRTAFFRPKEIGYLNDENHFICFSPGSSYGYRYSSEPVKIIREPFDSIENILSGQILDEDARQLAARDYLQKIAYRLVSVWAQVTGDSGLIVDQSENFMAERGPLAYLRWIAQTFFNSLVFVRLQHKAFNLEK